MNVKVSGCGVLGRGGMCCVAVAGWISGWIGGGGGGGRGVVATEICRSDKK